MYVASWSGGKDSCLAYYRARQQGYQVGYLVNFISPEADQRVHFHGCLSGLIKAQAEAMGIPLLQPAVPEASYEEFFKQTLRELLPESLEGMIFGDIYLEEHREWCRRVCAEVGIEAVHPIFGCSTSQVMADFLEAGFEAVIISGRPDYFTGEQMGWKLSQRFVEWCQSQEGMGICGESGEYHTVVVDGPSFRRRLVITESEPAEVNGHWFLDIRKWELANKAERLYSEEEG